MKIFNKRSGLFLTGILIAAVAVPLKATLAADDAGSLENIWAEQGQGQHSPQQQQQTLQQSQQEPQAVVSTATSVTTAAPMCTFEDFQKSTLAQKGGWPGVGPFRAGEDKPNDLVDPAGNHLRLQVSGDKVTVAELTILKGKPTSQDFLDLEMAADFLLEAVGSKAKKIAGLNSEMEANKQAILYKSDASPLNLKAGHYLVYIHRQPVQASGGYNYSIRVNSRDISKDVLKEHSASQGDGSAPLPGPENTTASATPETRPVETPESTAGTTGDALKEEFINVIKNWQKVKKTVVRQRQTEMLSEALSGRALARQTDAVKWLVDNHKFYDMTPLGVSVYRYSELSPGSKFSVIALVKESSKLIDEASGKVVKETTDTYKVNYTIEKVGNRWLITDSAIVPAAQPSQAARPQSGKTSH